MTRAVTEWGGSWLRNALALAGAATIASVAAPTGLAHGSDHRPPRVVLHAGAERQRGYRFHSQWVQNPKGPFCTVTYADNLNMFPGSLAYRGDEVSIRLKKATAPVEVEVVAWRKLNRNGAPAGKPSSVPHAIAPHLVDGQVTAWDAIVPLTRSSRHIYLQATASWRDEDHCFDSGLDLGSQYGTWRFHIRR